MLLVINLFSNDVAKNCLVIYCLYIEYLTQIPFLGIIFDRIYIRYNGSLLYISLYLLLVNISGH